MTHTNYTRNILNIKDHNIIFDENCLEEKTINKVTYKVFHGKLTYTPSLCPNCGCIYENNPDTIIKYGFKKNCKIKMDKLSNYSTILLLDKQRFFCKHCKSTFIATSDLVDFHKQISNNTKMSITLELMHKSSEKDIARRNNVSSSTVNRILDSISEDKIIKNNGKLPEVIGIDEFKGNCGNEKYQLHIFDLDTRKTIDIVKSRKYDDLEAYFSSFTLEQRCKVKIVSMDLYSPFKRIIKEKFCHALIVADNFHFTKLVIQALDELRLNLWKNTKGIEKRYFKNLKLSLAKDSSKLTEKEAEKLLYAFEISPILKCAYQLKQQFLDIKKLTTYQEKEIAFRKWLDDTESSTINEFKKTVKTLRQWHEYISNSFKLSVSNGPVEGKNNLIKTLKRISFGFRNLTNFKERIILCSL